MTKIIIVDSGVWISAFLKRDKHHEKGKKFLEWLNSQKSNKIITIDYIISEVMSYLRKKSDPLLANEVLDLYLNHEKIDIYYSNENVFNKAIEIFKKYTQLSLVDSIIVFFYLRLECDYLLSYDSGFNSYQGIKRLEMPI